jgi:hypothetical protein
MSMKNPSVFFDIEIGGKPEGRITFELYADVVPKTAEKYEYLKSYHVFFLLYPYSLLLNLILNIML